MNACEHANPTIIDPYLGRRVGNFQISRRVGTGDSGSVYVAEHPLIGRRVALKILHASLVSDREAVDRFFGEARIISKLRHPHIVDVVDFGVVDAADGQPATLCFVMEYLEGSSLAELLAGGRRFELHRALVIAAQIAEALDEVHRHGVVHRDLKPENVFLVPGKNGRERVKLLDFGIAKLVGNHRTAAGRVLGSAAYLAPEQCEGRADARTDVYGLAVLLFRMLTGRVPFEGGGDNRVALRHLLEPPPPLTRYLPVPAMLEELCLNALAKDPDERPQSMRDFRRGLASATVGMRGPRFPVWWWKPAALGVAVAVAVLLLVCAGVALASP